MCKISKAQAIKCQVLQLTVNQKKWKELYTIISKKSKNYIKRWYIPKYSFELYDITR
jgi:hypothetical protein